jgi:hypothetical protein
MVSAPLGWTPEKTRFFIGETLLYWGFLRLTDTTQKAYLKNRSIISLKHWFKEKIG